MNPGEMTDIHDIAGLLHSPWPDRFFILLIVAAVALIVFGVGLAWKVLQKRKSAVVALTPFERAQKSLKALQNVHARPADQFYWQLTETFKRYATEALDADCLDKTREEIRRHAQVIARHCRNEAQWQDLLALIDRSEQIKFAKEPAQAADMMRDLALVDDFVTWNETKRSDKQSVKS